MALGDERGPKSMMRCLITSGRARLASGETLSATRDQMIAGANRSEKSVQVLFKNLIGHGAIKQGHRGMPPKTVMLGRKPCNISARWFLVMGGRAERFGSSKPQAG
ncbi:MAG: hypothetical protein R3E79_38860 [Caldilineaceae bacterium]